jgi:hypothetical protein
VVKNLVCLFHGFTVANPAVSGQTGNPENMVRITWEFDYYMEPEFAVSMRKIEGSGTQNDRYQNQGTGNRLEEFAGKYRHGK